MNTNRQNPDKQVLYIGPEENLTDVRERLEHVSTQHVVLNISSQTQLRNYFAWKLLSLRARELGQEISVVSSDQRVCALARAASFNVTSTAPSTTSSRSRRRSSQKATGT